MQGLCRTTPHTFEGLSEEDKAPLKAFIKEIVETGFKTGLLYEGLTQYPERKPGGNPEEVAQHCWDKVGRPNANEDIWSKLIKLGNRSTVAR